MEGRCERHLFDRAVDLCGRCGNEYCPDCLVYSFGPTKPPFCLPCAVEAAGVRQGAGRPMPNRKEQRQMRRRREEFLAGRAAAQGAIATPVTVDEAWLDRLDDDGLASGVAS